MPHVEFPGRVGEHLEEIILLFLRVLHGLEELFLLPILLPALFYRVGIVPLLHLPSSLLILSRRALSLIKPSASC